VSLLRQAEPAMTAASLTPLTHGAGKLMVFASLLPRFAGIAAPSTGPLADGGSPWTTLSWQAEPTMTSASLTPLTHGAGDPMALASVRPRFADSTEPLTALPANVGTAPGGPLRQAEPAMTAASLAPVTRGAGELMVFASQLPPFTDTTGPSIGSPDVGDAPAAALLRRAKPVLTSASLLPVTGSAGEPMVAASQRPRFADMPGGLTGSPAHVDGAPAALSRQAEPVLTAASPLRTAADGAGESMIFASQGPRFADMPGALTGPPADVGGWRAVLLQQADPAMTSAFLMPVTRGGDEPMVLASLWSQSASMEGPLSRNTTALEMADRRTGVAGTSLVNPSGRRVVIGASMAEAFGDRGPVFPSGSYDVTPAPPRSAELPLRAVWRRYGAAMFSAGSSAAGAPIYAAAIVAARAEAPGSAVHQPGLPPVPALEAPVPADVGSVTETPARADRAEAAPDADDIVERAWRELMSRLAIEQERRGFGRWA